MGKIVTIYLTDAESVELKAFCDENQCTQYSALKTALRELLVRPIQKAEETPLINPEDEPLETPPEDDETPEERQQNDEANTSETGRFFIKLIKKKK